MKHQKHYLSLGRSNGKTSFAKSLLDSIQKGDCMKHTKEPWRVGNQCCIVSDTPIPEVDSMSSVEYYGGHCICESVTDTNAERIVACVNACQGITTEALEAGIVEKCVMRLINKQGVDEEAARFQGHKIMEDSDGK